MVNSTFYFIRRHVHSVIHDFDIYFPATISKKTPPYFLDNTKLPVTPPPLPTHKKKKELKFDARFYVEKIKNYSK